MISSFMGTPQTKISEEINQMKRVYPTFQRLSIYPSCLIKERVSEITDTNSILTCLISQDDFSALKMSLHIQYKV
jgi:hypothetical protein